MFFFVFLLDFCNRKEIWVLNSDNIVVGFFELMFDCLVELGSVMLYNGRKSSVDF